MNYHVNLKVRLPSSLCLPTRACARPPTSACLSLHVLTLTHARPPSSCPDLDYQAKAASLHAVAKQNVSDVLINSLELASSSSLISYSTWSSTWTIVFISFAENDEAGMGSTGVAGGLELGPMHIEHRKQFAQLQVNTIFSVTHLGTSFLSVYSERVLTCVSSSSLKHTEALFDMSLLVL